MISSFSSQMRRKKLSRAERASSLGACRRRRKETQKVKAQKVKAQKVKAKKAKADHLGNLPVRA
jgi:hypothetical protein